MKHDYVIISSDKRIGTKIKLFNNKGQINATSLSDVLVTLMKYAALLEKHGKLVK